MRNRIKSIKSYFAVEKSFYNLSAKEVFKNNLLFIDTFIKSILVVPTIIFLIFFPLSIIFGLLSGIISAQMQETFGGLCELTMAFGLIVEIPLGALVWSLFRIKLDKKSLGKNILSHLYSVIYIIVCFRGIYYGGLWGEKKFSMICSIPIIIIIIIPILRYIVIYFKSR